MFVRYPGVLVSGVANTDPKSHVDFETFWRSTVALLHGADTYHTGAILPNLNPPFLTLLLAPFGLLPVLPSYWLFTALSVLLVTWSVLAVARELRLGRGATTFGVLSMWACSPLHGTLLLGQIYGLLLAGLTLAWLAWRRGRPVLSAVVLGAVVALKPSLAPLVLIPLAQRAAPAERSSAQRAAPAERPSAQRAAPAERPSIQRRWSALWAGLASAGAASVVGVLVAGLSSASSWLRLATGTPAPEVDANASLPGLVARLHGPGVLGWLVTVLVVVGSLYWVRHSGSSANGDGVPGADVVARAERGAVVPGDVVIFAVAAGCLLASPIAWLNYLVMLWPGGLILLRAGWWRRAVPLLVLPVIPVAWGNLWQAAPQAPVSLLGRSLYCLVLLGYWVVLLRFAASSAAVPGSASADGSPSSQSTPVGGTRSTADAGRPCQGSELASAAPRLPTPEPP